MQLTFQQHFLLGLILNLIKLSLMFYKKDCTKPLFLFNKSRSLKPECTSFIAMNCCSYHYRQQTKFGARYCFYTFVSFCSGGLHAGGDCIQGEGALPPGGVCFWGVCIQGMFGRPPPFRYYGIWLMSRQYASYCNAFLLHNYS